MKTNLLNLIRIVNDQVKMINSQYEDKQIQNSGSNFDLFLKTGLIKNVMKIGKEEKMNIFLKEALNEKFLWFNNYSQYRDWDSELKKNFDVFNFSSIKEKNDFYFNNSNSLKSNRFLNHSVVPNPYSFRKIDLDEKSIVSLINTESYSKLTNKLNSVKKELLKNLEFSKNTLSFQLKYKITLLNLVHGIKNRLRDEEIVQLISNLEMVSSIKREYIDHYKKILTTKNESNKDTNIKINKMGEILSNVQYINRNLKSFIECFYEIDKINPSDNDFCKTVENERKQVEELSFLSSEKDLEENINEKIPKMEKWLNENYDNDAIFNASLSSNSLIEFTRNINSNNTNKFGDIHEINEQQFLNEKRILAELNLIAVSIFYNKLNENDNKNETQESNAKLDQEFLNLLEKVNAAKLNPIKQTPSKYLLKNMSLKDCELLDSISENINFTKLVKEETKLYSINDILLELSKFIDSMFAHKYLLNKNCENISKSDRLINLENYENMWRRHKMLTDKEIADIIDLFMVGKNLTDFENAWNNYDRSSLKILLEKANKYDERENIISDILRLKTLEIKNRTRWPSKELKYNFNELLNEYKESRKEVLKPLLVQILDKKSVSVESKEAPEILISEIFNQICIDYSIENSVKYYNILSAIELNFDKELSLEQRNFLNLLDKIFEVKKYGKVLLNNDNKTNLLFEYEMNGNSIDAFDKIKEDNLKDQLFSLKNEGNNFKEVKNEKITDNVEQMNILLSSIKYQSMFNLHKELNNSQKL